ncbi:MULTISPECIES: RraA family protein [unclassified Mesorhizobium]|uniref:RraA family protein n=1 Tax=unclassified Mesorhizobium TaxID=325217 RepID=UPI00112EC9F4|nr:MULTISPECIES: RraA family protein [unclassified Mesorhizobium]TPM07263.1 RraA family protein [Mesorhizobium sp. B2-3-8]TPM15972.1 RraA family protein [Mesorhizobium sp. B2-3-7]
MTTDTDKAIFEVIHKELFTAVVGDVLDVMGHRRQFLPAGIAPLQPEMKVIGRAMPVLEADVFSGGSPDAHGPLANKPFGLMMEALDSLTENDVYIASGSSFRYALWGGLMSTRAQKLKAAGAVLNGYIRDSWEIEELGFSVFSRGIYAQDQGPRGKVIDHGCPIEIEGILVSPGDLIFGDREGVLVIPREAEKEAIERALEKVSTENKVATAIRDGMSACEAFRTFGVM